VRRIAGVVHQLLGTLAERHDHIPSVGARLAPDWLLQSEQLDRVRQVARAQHPRQRLESRNVRVGRFQLPHILNEPLGPGRRRRRPQEDRQGDKRDAVHRCEYTPPDEGIACRWLGRAVVPAAASADRA
jgi:hypothetical protein